MPSYIPMYRADAGDGFARCHVGFYVRMKLLRGPEQRQSKLRNFPQRLKATIISPALAARLKSCPVAKRTRSDLPSNVQKACPSKPALSATASTTGSYGVRGTGLR